MARLPVPGADQGQWGQILNEYLSISHNSDGSLKDGVVTKTKLSATGGTSGQVLSTDGTSLSWATVSGSGTVPDATASVKGIVQLAGDLGGTAASPTVPGLAAKADASAMATALNGKENTVTAGTTGQYYRGDKTWQTHDKSSVGLANVDNTSDASKPVSTATASALAGKANTSHTHTASDVTDFSTAADARIGAASINALADVTISSPSNGQVLKYNGSVWVNDADATGGAGATDITITRTGSDVTVVSSSGIDGTIVAADTTNAGVLSAADKTKLNGIATGATANATDAQLRDRSTHTGTQPQSSVVNLTTDLAAKEPSITAGTTGQYYRGDKSWQTLDKTAVGLANVDNTSDANKPVSSATQTALNLKANTSSLATVATSGSYVDLTNKPTIPKITASNTAPSSPAVGDMWLDLSV